MDLRDLKLRLRALITPSRVEQELHDELSFHIEREAMKLIGQGMPPDEGRAKAQARFGSTTVAILNRFLFRVDQVPAIREMYAVERLRMANGDRSLFTRRQFAALRRETSVFTDAYPSCCCRGEARFHHPWKPSRPLITARVKGDADLARQTLLDDQVDPPMGMIVTMRSVARLETFFLQIAFGVSLVFRGLALLLASTRPGFIRHAARCRVAVARRRAGSNWRCSGPPTPSR